MKEQLVNNNDLFNLTIATSPEEVDSINKKFYGKYNYPWPPRSFPAYPADMAVKMLNQDIGSWDHARIPAKPRIWVAGCGTNQALFTALRFPEAEVIGTDLSVQSLQLGRKNAAQMGITNLKLEEKSINEVTYSEEFDYIICTGVVHHNANPELTLAKLAGALKPTGVIEFMVYNYYHRLMTTACQNAVRTFYNREESLDMDLEMTIVKKLIAHFPFRNLMGEYMRTHHSAPEAKIADCLLQPVEYSYTIESLAKLVGHGNLELLIHCINQTDVAVNALNWNTHFDEPLLAQEYEALSDNKRWQISNLLMLNDSPMLWFYLQRNDVGTERQSEGVICEGFLESKFAKNTFPVKNHVINLKGSYALSDRTLTYPLIQAPADAQAKKIWDAVSPELTMREVFLLAGSEPTFQNVNNARIQLTTSAFPYLLAQ
ncbi:class I SAM-dependent methyltransferase [Hymenobacter elongatus]|uniref:Class I SAM-dependent methyltransferase n=1 Tax=Hymenobacter elongatus TaxID=877208 RepID=A0A4Z0PIF0_9BACT|nr:class I SAM-dependent methyltransferase [Hymenobacter elongatus]TGE15081.1 class I SAM-dependent methyltransferase [Hymenobacter elongatus]